VATQSRTVGYGIQPADQPWNCTEHLDYASVPATVLGEKTEPDVSDAGGKR
jgi:hypothetical protein